jgi:hypothetical protein
LRGTIVRGYFSVTSRALQILVYCSLLRVCFVRCLLTIFSMVLIRLTEKRKHLEDELKDAIAERDRNKMTNHHFEQELRRVQSIIDCMVQLNPHQVKHIQKIQPDFRFKVHCALVCGVVVAVLHAHYGGCTWWIHRPKTSKSVTTACTLSL